MSRVLAALLIAAVAAAGPARARTLRPLPKTWQKGVNVAAFRWNGFTGRRFERSMRRLKADHAGEAMFVTRWFQYWRDGLRGDDVNATQIQPSYGTAARCAKWPRSDFRRCQTPSLAAEADAIRLVRRLGLKAAVKPLVDVGRDAQNSYDRSKVDFRTEPERQAWFRSYRAMLAPYARMARDTGADTLVIGTGLTGMTNESNDVELWRQLIADVRSGALMADGRGGFAGKLTYATRWDAIYSDASDPSDHEMFWADLDEIGVEGFWPLVNGNDPEHDDPSVAKLRQGWTYNFIRNGIPPGAALRALHEEYGKPVVLTGLGYLSRGGTSAEPSKGNYAQKAAGGTFNLEAQLRPYKAAFDFWGNVARTQGWFEGIYWWNWLPKPGSPRNGDYSPQGKPAERELCERFAGRVSRAGCP